MIIDPTPPRIENLSGDLIRLSDTIISRLMFDLFALKRGREIVWNVSRFFSSSLTSPFYSDFILSVTIREEKYIGKGQHQRLFSVEIQVLGSFLL